MNYNDFFASALDKLREESAELQHALQSGSAPKIEEEMGDLLFAAVNLARFLHVDPEIALKRANAKFSARFRQMESGGIPNRYSQARRWRACGNVPRRTAARPRRPNQR